MPVAGPPFKERREMARHAARFAAVVLLVLAGGGCATTGTIRGALMPPPSSAPPTRGKNASGVAWRDTTSLKRAVAYIVDDGEPPPRTPLKLPLQHIRQTRAGFVPAVTVIRAGTTVSFENSDSVYHSAFSVEAANHFDTGLFAPGKASLVVFDHPGIVKLYCAIHPRSTGLLIVTPNGHYARPDGRGEFRLPSLRRGTYTLTAWHPSYGATTMSVRVPEDCRAPLRVVF